MGGRSIAECEAMSQGPVVSNSSPLIALDRIAHLHLLNHLFGTLVVPPAVSSETSPLLTLPQWISERAVTQPIPPQVVAASVGPGEREAIGLAIECNASWVILDDRPARRLARELGLPVVGTLGVLVAAKRRGFLKEVRSCLDDLI